MDETRKSGRVTRRGKASAMDGVQQLRGKMQETTASPKSTASRVAKAPSSARRHAAAKSAEPGIESAPAEPVQREEWIRVAAYYRAERRGFTPGHDLEDWYAAEAGLMSMSAAPRRSRARKPATETRAAR